MYPTLTKKQKDILEYIKVYANMHGYSPSLEEIKAQFRLSAISTVHEHIQNLKKKGYIHNEINQARSIQPIDPNLMSKDFIEVPIVYTLNKNDVLETNKNQRTVAVAKELLNKEGSYLALIIETEQYKECGVLAGDILVLKESPEVKHAAVVVAQTKTNRAFILKVDANGKLEPCISTAPIAKNLCLKATVCTLIRKFT